MLRSSVTSAGPELPGVPDDAASREVPVPTDQRWQVALQRVVDEPELQTLHAQPIVDLASGEIAGYEMLSRISGPWAAPPDRWFAAAEVWGVNAVLQARVLRAAVRARTALPPDTFLTVNLDPHLLVEREVECVLRGATDLTRLVIELTEHTRAEHRSEAAAVLAHARRVGAMVAMDDAGAGYAGLSQLLTLRPHMVKLDRDLITGIDTDPVKAALVEVFGDLAGRMDAWILAEGIETEAELDTLIRLGVPLGQGWALGHPAPTMLAELAPPLVDHIRTTALRTSLQELVASLVRPCDVGGGRTDDDVLTDRHGQAVAVRVADGAWSPAVLVSPTTPIVDAARRAMSRDARHRHAPLVCTDSRGGVVGLVGVDDMVLALCASSSAATSSSADPRPDP